jgi:hypothetical protein
MASTQTVRPERRCEVLCCNGVADAALGQLLLTADRPPDRCANATFINSLFVDMKFHEHPAPQERPLAVIADLVRAYEARIDRPRGVVVCRFVAEEEPEVFAAMAADTGLTTEELWRYIESEEQVHYEMRGRGFSPTPESAHHNKMKTLRDENERP